MKNPSKLTLLLVDDDVDDREIFAECVEALDPTIRCRTAKSGEEMMQLLRTGSHPDYIFLDLNMPGLQGIQCLAELKSNDIWKDIPVIIYTTSSDPIMERECEKLGAHHFITKPNSIKDITNVINMVLFGLWPENS